MANNLSKILVILGPTASGKTDLGIALAKKFNGEIISADSRQVYKKMDVATAKPAGKREGGVYVVNGIPHYLLDIIDPADDFSLADFKALALKHIREILRRRKLPIIVGGTGLYIWSIVDNLNIPKVAPDKNLRVELEKKNLAELVELFKRIDPRSAQKVDLKNPRRVLRALEVVITSGESFFAQRKKAKPLFDVLQIGIELPRPELRQRIEARVDRQIEQGLVKEVRELAKRYNWNLPSMSGIGYKQMGYYLRGEKSLAEAIEILKQDTKKYAKRQVTWFKRDKRICWIEAVGLNRAEELVRGFLKNKNLWKYFSSADCQALFHRPRNQASGR